ncbi:hypothetical protein P872_11125 [Rhodonellum psychrophilum GCM71 = DSM 17998]|uniref:Uncharacterized protein n=2 Tax=Rhodonellum TaxID=336827 RepID=U5BW98_9BACT|nr:hypothetical protein P872_11125 [Rhodonellum psychrophilum GCM71 = DSM 17998]
MIDKVIIYLSKTILIPILLDNKNWLNPAHLKNK